MNDVREVDYADKVLREAIKEMSSEELERMSFSESIAEEREHIKRNAFVFSLSRSADSLNLGTTTGRMRGTTLVLVLKLYCDSFAVALDSIMR